MEDFLRGDWRYLSGSGEGEDEYSWDQLYASLVFMIALWGIGKLVSFAGAPPLVGQIITGMILGPYLLEFVPKVGAWKMIGELGLMLLVIEAGVEVDLEMLRLIGVRGAIVAVAGSMVPLAIGFFIGDKLMGLDMKGSFVVGASVSPTSMGIALSVLRASKLLNSPTGQLIIAAAVLDDIIALILLSELSALEDPTGWNIVKPILVAFLLLFGFGFVAIYIIPRILNRFVFPRVKPEYEDNLALALLFLLALGLAPAARAAGGSYLLGCFIAGLSFCTSEQVQRVWVSQVKRILTWLLRIFFGCTIAFEIPVSSFANVEVVKHAAMILIALIGKIATFIWARPLTKFNAMVVSTAMSALGEFAFIVVVYAKQEAFVSDDIAASIILTILITIIISPILLRLVIGYFTRKAQRAVDKARNETGEDAKGNPPLYYFVQTRCTGSMGLQDRFLRAIMDSNLEIVDIRSYHPRVNDFDVYIIFEAFLCDHTMRLPASRYRSPNHDEEGAIRQRLRTLYEDVKKALRDPENGNVRVGRWYAGIQSEEDEIGTEAAFGLAEKLLQERNKEFEVSVNRMEQDDDQFGLGGFVHQDMQDIDFLLSNARSSANLSHIRPHGLRRNRPSASTRPPSHRQLSLRVGSRMGSNFGGSRVNSITQSQVESTASIGLLEVYEHDDDDESDSSSDDGSTTQPVRVEILDHVTDIDIDKQI